ncbi:MAG TPA: prepilin peptidase [Alphaproteobacteria bacterium]|nr:prepilin peptidase [Alphaproteobacteria bacterium]
MAIHWSGYLVPHHLSFWAAESVHYITQSHPGVWVALGAMSGAVFGSFLNCARYRLPRGLSLWRPAHSFCPSCKHKLQVKDLIPILSWVALRGRCRYCHGGIGTQSLWLEVATTAIGAFAAFIAVQIALHF